MKREIFARLRYTETMRNNEDVVFFAMMVVLYDSLAIAVYVGTIHERKECCRHNIVSIRATSDRVVVLLVAPDILFLEYCLFKDEFLSAVMCCHGRYREAREVYGNLIRIHFANLSTRS